MPRCDSASAAEPDRAMMGEKQRRDRVARAIDRDRQLRRPHAVRGRLSSHATRSIASSGVSSVTSEVTSTVRGPERAQRFDGSDHLRQIASFAAGEVVELEVVGRDDIGGRDCVLRA